MSGQKKEDMTSEECRINVGDIYVYVLRSGRGGEGVHPK